MKVGTMCRAGCMLIALASMLCAQTAAAKKKKNDQTTGIVKGSVSAVAVAVDPTFQELDIEVVDSTVTEAYAMAVGEAETGSRVIVSISSSGRSDCEVTVTTDAPRDEELEVKVLETLRRHVD